MEASTIAGEIPPGTTQNDDVMRASAASPLSLLLLCAGCGDLTTIDARDDTGGVFDAALADAAFDGDGFDGGGLDGGIDAGSDAGGPTPTRYPPGRIHSPITPDVAANIRQIFSRGSGLSDDVFAKVGDSITVSTSFMHCFDGGAVLDGRDLQATLDWFDAAGSSPFSRTSIAAGVGWHAGRALEGSPNPLVQEISAIRPAYAIVMYGTNDIGFRGIETFADNVLTITDTLLDDGIVPILSSIPARADMASIDANVPRWNMAVRALAQARQIPFMDYHLAMEGLPNRGLGGDGVHPSASGNSCDFTAAGLMNGYNVRNLLALEALDRTRSAIEGDMLDPRGAPLVGDGSPAAPFVIDALPFAHVADTSASEHRNLDLYDCATQDEGGPEYLYELRLDSPTSLWIAVFDRGSVDIDIHVLDSPDEAGCVARAHESLEVDLAAGTYWLALDTFVSGSERAGEYVLAVMAE